MKVTLITYYTPYKENRGGISALPYYLILGRPKDIQVIIYSFNANNLSEEIVKEVESELNVKIVIMPLPKWYAFLKNHNVHYKIGNLLSESIDTYITMPREFVRQIKKQAPDCVWIYTSSLYRLSKHFKDFPCIVTGCDFHPLLYKRAMETPDNYSKLRQHLLPWQYKQRLRTMKAISALHLPIHFVGLYDLELYDKLIGDHRGFYIPHPHYLYREKEIKFSHPHLKVLIAGAYSYTTKVGIDDLIHILEQSAQRLKDKIEITFLGKNWDVFHNRLRDAGYSCFNNKFAPDYIEFISQFDIQIIPISMGAGTKGKTLDAIANGLLTIGLPYALENIDENNEGSIMYHHASELLNLFEQIYSHPEKYEAIAERGRDMVLNNHDPEVVSKQFFDKMEAYIKSFTNQ